MPATPDRIEFIIAEHRIVKFGPDAGVVTKHGSSARRTGVVPTFFEAQADAQAMCDERGALLSPDRRRFTTEILGEATGLGMAYTVTTPALTLIDDDFLANHTALVSEIKINFSKATTTIESWG